jgi:hypothetical protein
MPFAASGRGRHLSPCPPGCLRPSLPHSPSQKHLAHRFKNSEKHFQPSASGPDHILPHERCLATQHLAACLASTIC